MPVLSDLEPREVFAWFERLCAIPHGSHHAKAISDYLVAFARERGLACRQDAANNVVIRKAASAGYENAPVIMLQGHIDMVCEKDADCGKDMETEGLDLFVDGDVIGARGRGRRPHRRRRRPSPCGGSARRRAARGISRRRRSYHRNGHRDRRRAYAHGRRQHGARHHAAALRAERRGGDEHGRAGSCADLAQPRSAHLR